MKPEKAIEMLRIVAEDLVPVSNARLSAAIFYRGKLVSIGFNQFKSHPFAAKYSRHPEAIYLHAETDAIYKASKRLTRLEMKTSTLVICRVKQCNKNKPMYGLAKPCFGCQDCIDDYGLSTVIYTTDSVNMEYITSLK